MGNIIDYILTETHDFIEHPFNDVDSLVLSQSAYLHYGKLYSDTLDPAASCSFAEILSPMNIDALLEGVGNQRNNLLLINALASSPRFSGIRPVYHVDVFDPSSIKQFAATTFLLPDDSVYVAYRGTDATLIGWQEDFDMAFITPIPAQTEALNYLRNIFVQLRPSLLRVGGHSKGGNLAVYASMYASGELQNAICAVYSHDGPGFNEKILLGEGFLRIQDRIHKTLPHSSVIGMLLQHQERYRIVESSRMGIMQHDPFSWQIQNGKFVYVDELSQSATYVNQALNEWLASLSESQRKLFVDTLFQVLEASGATYFKDLTHDWQSKALATLAAIKNVDKETRTQIIKTLGLLFLLSVKHFSESIKSQITPDSQ